MTRKTQFKKLLEPLQIRGVKCRNRMVKVATETLWSENGGFVGEKTLGWYEALARGGVGMITTEGFMIDSPLGIIPGIGMMDISDDKFIPGLSKLAQVIHKHGCPTFLQMAHLGPMHPQADTGLQALSASALSDDERPQPSPLARYPMAREITIPEIEDVEEKFVKAAERAQKAGFDGIELMAGHSYLLNSFLSLAYNKRQDAYGCQDLKSRTRIMVELIQAIKKRLGQDYPVGVKMNGKEWGLKKGITAEESQGIARIMEEAGADYLCITGFGYGDFAFANYTEEVGYPEPTEATKDFVRRVKKPGGLIPEAEAIKKVVSIPVISTGRLDLEVAEWLLQKNKVDLIAMGRPLIADPELPNKVASGKIDDIRPCLACMTCISIFALSQPIRCRVNAAFGREREYAIKPAEKKKKVMIIGSGPGGMEAARAAALRGHEVLLHDRQPKLGGLLPMAALVKGFEIEDLTALIHYYKIQLRKLGVKVRLGKEVDLALVEEVKPDVVILATGGEFTVPEIPGADRHNVTSSSELHGRAKGPLGFLGPQVLSRLTRFYLPVGKRVVIIGGLIHGCQTAEFLVKRGRQVTIVETSDQLGAGIPLRKKVLLLKWLSKKGVTTLTGVTYEEITDKGLTFVTREGKRQTIETDTILVATPPKANTELFKILQGKAPEVYQIGDCREPGLIIDAIADGLRVGYAI